MQDPTPTKPSDLLQPSAEKKQRIKTESDNVLVSLSTSSSLNPVQSQSFNTDRILHENPLQNDASQINLNALDFDLQHSCAVTSQTFNLFMCLSCGTTLSGKHASSPAISHANKSNHYLYICLDDTSIWLFPDDYELICHEHSFDSIRENCSPSQMLIHPHVYQPLSQQQGVFTSLNGQPYIAGIRPFQSVSNSTWLTSVFLFFSRIAPIRDYFLNTDVRTPTTTNYMERLYNLRQLSTNTSPTQLPTTSTPTHQQSTFLLPPPHSLHYGSSTTSSPLIHFLTLTMKKLFHTHAIHNYIHPFFSMHFFNQFLESAPHLAKLSEFDKKQPQTLFTSIITRLQQELMLIQSKQQPKTQAETLLQQHMQGQFQVHTITTSRSTDQIISTSTTNQPFFFLPIQAPLELQQSTMSQQDRTSHFTAQSNRGQKQFSVELQSLLSRFTGTPQVTESIDPKTKEPIRVVKTMQISHFPQYLIFVVQRRYINHNTGVDYSRAVIECPAGLDFKNVLKDNIKYDLHANVSTELNLSQQQGEMGNSSSNKDYSWNQRQKSVGDTNSTNPSEVIHNLVSQHIMPYKIYLNDHGFTNRWYCINNLSVITAPHTEKEAHQSCSVLLLFKMRE